MCAGFRYTCEQGEDIHGYGWDEYDARTGGIQSIHDDGNGIDITTSFVKVPGGGQGGNWGARIKGQVQEGKPKDFKYMLFYFIAHEGTGLVEPTGEGDQKGYTGDVTFKGATKSLGEFTLSITEGTGNHPTSGHAADQEQPGHTTNVYSGRLNSENQWQAKALALQAIQENIQQSQEKYSDGEDFSNLPPMWQILRTDHVPAMGNVHLVQKIFEGDFEFDVMFNSASAGKDITSEDITREIKQTSESFSERFQKTFSLNAPFNKEKYQNFAKSMFSNLLGGVGYFRGEQLIDRSYAEEFDEESEGFWEDTAKARARGQQKMEGPYELFTSVPSRPFFPRGFLWDEGFHLIPIADWDIDLTLEIVKSWYNTMDSDGWIPREQILGEEARSKVPPEFQVQYPHYANPPTLFLIIEGFMERWSKAKGAAKSNKENLDLGADLYNAHINNPELGEDFLRRIYPLLKRQYEWFRSTQRGEIKAYDREATSSKEAYRWKGRTETHCLTSGIDDYPRPSPPHPGELHVDLMAWVGLMTKSLKNIAEALDIEDDVESLQKNLKAIENNLNDLHWSEKEGCFCDATIDDFEEHSLVCHKGYVSLFPFLLGLMKPDDHRLGKILDLLGDEEELWSAHGIRSLSKKDIFYETGENYWRSPVWMPINYLALSQLHVSVVEA